MQPPEPPQAGLRRHAIALMAACTATSVANVYYAQPLLDAIGASVQLPDAAVGSVITAVQIGCALALLLVVPAGDLFNRKTLVCVELALLPVALSVVAMSSTSWVLMGGMVALGLLGTAITQGTIAYAATQTSPDRRGQVVGSIQGGVLVGVLGSRALAGLVADEFGWRSVFLASAAAALAMLIGVARALPDAPAPKERLPYTDLLATMARLLQTDRTLQVRGLLGLLVFSAFGAFWSSLVLPLREAPYHLSHTAVGLFGLIGLAGALAATRVGGLVDRGHAQATTGAALLCMTVAWIPISLLHESLFALGIGIILLDLGGQAVHVSNQALILKSRPELHARLLGAYMLFYAVGLGGGAITATWLYALLGWGAVCGLGASLSLMAGLFWALTRPPR